MNLPAGSSASSTGLNGRITPPLTRVSANSRLHIDDEMIIYSIYVSCGSNGLSNNEQDHAFRGRRNLPHNVESSQEERHFDTGTLESSDRARMGQRKPAATPPFHAHYRNCACTNSTPDEFVSPEPNTRHHRGPTKVLNDKSNQIPLEWIFFVTDFCNAQFLERIYYTRSQPDSVTPR